MGVTCTYFTYLNYINRARHFVQPPENMDQQGPRENCHRLSTLGVETQSLDAFNIVDKYCPRRITVPAPVAACAHQKFCARIDHYIKQSNQIKRGTGSWLNIHICEMYPP
jgi:hypothetical protein